VEASLRRRQGHRDIAEIIPLVILHPGARKSGGLRVEVISNLDKLLPSALRSRTEFASRLMALVPPR